MESRAKIGDLTGINSTDKQPNIILILVDQMRFPMHLPPGTSTADQFVEKYMPNLFESIWREGVKFTNHYTAASDCTSARASIFTGLYSYQTYSMLTLITYPGHGPTNWKPQQPELQPGFPTIGHLLRRAGYETPYFGKWHLSYDASDLQEYGFDSHTPAEDLPGFQGQGLQTDGGVAAAAAAWVTARVESGNEQPFFLSVNFVNPHDKQFFWGATQASDFNNVYQSIPEQPAQNYVGDIIPEDAPPSYGYSTDITQAIPNWESQTQLSAKPKAQMILKEVFQYQMGGYFEEDEKSSYTPVPSTDAFWYAPTPLVKGRHKAVASTKYWTRALDSYMQVLQMADDAIGAFLKSIPAEVRENAVFIFTSDHGEYGSSHGLQGKGASIYEEGILVPFVVCDRSGRFAVSAERKRTHLTSSVDLLPMIVSIGHGGSKEWMQGDYLQLYGNRCDLLNILRDPNAREKSYDLNAPGRDYVLHATDEFIPASANYLNAPSHVIGLIRKDGQGSKQKLGIYANWAEYAFCQHQARVLNDEDTQVEYYDHSTGGGAGEVENTPDAQKAQAALKEFWGVIGSPGIISRELQATLPRAYRPAQRRAYRQLRRYMRLVNALTHDKKQKTGALEEYHQRLARVWSY